MPKRKNAERERAEQEVLQRRLLRQQPAATGQPAQQVERQREHLERDEHRQQVAGGREQHHAADREQRQREDLGRCQPGARAARLVRRPGEAAPCGVNASPPGRRGPLGHGQHAEDATARRIVPCRNSVGPSTTIAPRPRVAAAGRAVGRRRTTATNAADQADQRRATTWIGVADRRGANASTRTPTQRGAEDDQHRRWPGRSRSSAPAGGRRPAAWQRHWRRHFGAPAAGTVGRRVGDADLLHGRGRPPGR